MLEEEVLIRKGLNIVVKWIKKNFSEEVTFKVRNEE